MGKLHIRAFTFNPFYENTYVVYGSKEALLVDVGCDSAEERSALESFLLSSSLEVSAIVCTHAHIDHVLGLSWAQSRFGVSAYIHSAEEEIIRSLPAVGKMFGYPSFSPIERYDFLDMEKGVDVEGQHLSLRHVPGHSPGHVVLYYASGDWVLGGDTLFKNSMGRTDLPGGDHQTLLNSIKSGLFSLPDKTVVYPGHGETTTIGHEKRHNPFVHL